MSEHENQIDETPQETVLVLDRTTKKVDVLQEIPENGSMERINALKKNQSQFMRVDKNGDFLSNFYTNFFDQFKNPTNFLFFKVPLDHASAIAKSIQQQVSKGVEGDAIQEFKQYGMVSDQVTKNANGMEQQNNKQQADQGYRYDPSKIDWELMSNIGLSERELIERDLLEPLLKGYKTNGLVPLAINLGQTVARFDARLSLQTNDTGDVVVAIHGIRKEPSLNYPLFGHEFTVADKENLLKTGNMGRVVDLVNPKTDSIIPSVISIDRLTNELVAFPVERMKIPDEIKGIALNADQKQTLAEGKPLYLEGLLSKKGTTFDAKVQFNADKRYVEFLFDRQPKQNVSNRVERPRSSMEASKVFRGKELTQDQYTKFKAGETVFIEGLIDKKGKAYQGYITFNKETAKTSFVFPEQFKENIMTPLEHKTSVGVNSEGKVNKAAKHSKGALESNQISTKNSQDNRVEPNASKAIKAKRPRL